MCATWQFTEDVPLLTSGLTGSHTATVALTEVTAETRQRHFAFLHRLHGQSPSYTDLGTAGKFRLSKTCRRQSREKTKSTSSVLNLVWLGPHLQITGGDDACEGSQQPFGFWLQNRELTSSGPGTSLSCRCRSTSCLPRAWAAPHKTPLHNSKSASGSAQESLACNALLHSFKCHVLH